MCHSTQNGYKIFEAQPKKAFRLIYRTETELNRRLYGEPETMWVDSASSLILLKTADKSLHMIHNKTKLWTKPFGLTSISQIIPYADSYYVKIHFIYLVDFN